MIFRKRTATNDDAVPGPTPMAIAEAVRRSAAHQLAEHKLAGVRQRYAAAVDRLRAAHAGSDGNPESAAIMARQAGAEVERLEAELRDVRREIQPLRDVHRQRVEAELAPLRREAAQRVEVALADLGRALAGLNAVHAAGRRFGADWLTVSADGIDDLRNQLRGIN